MSDTEERLLEQAENEIDTLDGYFNITTDEQGIFLAVFPPQGSGKPVKSQAILDAFSNLGIDKVDNALLIRTVKEAAGTPVKFGEKPVEAEPDIEVVVSRDRMEASLNIVIPKGCRRQVSMEEVMEKIQKAGVVFGIDQAIIQRAFEKPGVMVVFAQGKKQENGTNASIKYAIDFENKGRPVELEDGRVDYKNLNMFITVEKDQLLAAKIPATPGESGTDVLGNEVVAKPGKDVVLPLGKNVVAIDKYSIVAGQAGQVVVQGNKIHVIPVIEIKEDVDLSTGNVEFVGSVVIRGSVQTGFSVKAEGDVEIGGNVCGGIVEGKNIIIRMGIQGMNRGYVKAGENVVAKFAENATIIAGKDAIVDDVVLHSRISAGKHVTVLGKRGLIVGGHVSAGEEIKAKVVGTNLATNTDLEVGVNPALREEYQQIRKEVKKVELSLEQTQKALNLLRSMNQATLPPDKREMLLKLTKAQFHLMGQLETMRNRITEIELQLEEMRHGRIKVADSVFPGVKVVVGTLVKPIRELVKFASFYAEDGEVKVGSYQ
ncbi:MAG TPA: FapA family protein [Methylomusa anaerophila]|uniref:Flagellar Assembly Protein A N-terminal region domain-containing protein n=1 Tax=Methylomusa anaerophila TaxID=1930071 RepID=A0A348AQ09_9FIRM|nr:FapA family protein [Methylomusa anaerophila]BBB93157.1 hypothetical protein MAMMFC1_03866 [Methylomusa anaerophila]HML87011.1 FapA family protein [Methylomusa anaerophila]